MPTCQTCGVRNPRENTTCRSCGAVLGTGPGAAAPGPDIAGADAQRAARVAGSDAQAAPSFGAKPAAAESTDAETQDLQLGRAAFFGVVAAAAVGAAWYFLEDAFQWSAALVFVLGWATAFAVTYGAGQKRGRPLQLISLGITLAAILVVRFLHDGLENPGEYLTRFWQWLMPEAEPMPLNMLFVMFGLWYAYSTPRVRPRRPQPREEPEPEPEEGEDEEAAEGADEEAGPPAASKDDPTRRCVRCQAQVPAGTAMLVPGGFRRGTLLVCPNCVIELETRFAAETEDIKLSPAAVYGVGAALLIGLGWYLLGIYTGSPLVSLIGFGAGWVLPEVLRFGAGKKRGRPLQYLAVGLTLAVIVGANVALAATASAGFMRTLGFQVVELISQATAMLPAATLQATPAPFLSTLGTLFADPLTDIIYLLALFQAYTGAAPRKLGGARETATTGTPS